MLFLRKDFYKAYVHNWLEGKNLFDKFNFSGLNRLTIKISKNGKTKILKK